MIFIYKDFTEEDINLFIKFLVIRKRNYYPLLEYVCLKEKFLSFYWAFAGKTIFIPDRLELQKLALYVIVYNFLQRNSFSDESIETAQRKFKLRKSRVIAIRVNGDRIVSMYEKKIQSYLEKFGGKLSET